MTSPQQSDTRYWPWRVEQGERESITFDVLGVDDAPRSITGWTVDARIKARPGGAVLYAWPGQFVELSPSGEQITLTIPGPVSAVWTWRVGWWRVVVSDPSSDPTDPTVERIISGPLIVDPG